MVVAEGQECYGAGFGGVQGQAQENPSGQRRIPETAFRSMSSSIAQRTLNP